MKISYCWPHAMGRHEYKALCISLGRVFCSANNAKNATLAKGILFQWLHMPSSALSCAVFSYSNVCHIPAGFIK